MRNDQRGLSCIQRREHSQEPIAPWRGRGDLKAVRGSSKDLGGFQEVAEACGKSSEGTETGDGSQAAGGYEKQCGALVKPLDSGARPWI